MRQLIVLLLITTGLNAEASLFKRKKTEIDGIGVVFVSSINSEEEVIDGKINKKLFIFVNNCGKVYLSKEQAEKYKENQTVKYRMSGNNLCQIQSIQNF